MCRWLDHFSDFIQHESQNKSNNWDLSKSKIEIELHTAEQQASFFLS